MIVDTVIRHKFVIYHSKLVVNFYNFLSINYKVRLKYFFKGRFLPFGLQ